MDRFIMEIAGKENMKMESDKKDWIGKFCLVNNNIKMDRKLLNNNIIMELTMELKLFGHSDLYRLET